MKCILLCAGYATRLFPLTENFPKALLEIGKDKPLLNYILDEVNTIDDIDEVFIITNNRYYEHFNKWASNCSGKKIKVVNDKSTSNDDRLGAIGDIQYTINNEKINDDVIIIAGDNLFDYPLKSVVEYYKEKKSAVVVGKELEDVELLKRFAVAKVDDTNKLTNLEEKPAKPKSNIAVYATYIYPKEFLPLIREYLEEGNNPDAPGYFVEYLYKIRNVYIYKFQGNCYDVGTHEELKRVRKLYGGEE